MISKQTCHIHVVVGDGNKELRTMGQKIHPTGFRLAVNRNWSSKWFANSKNYARHRSPQDIKVREYLKQEAGARVGGARS